MYYEASVISNAHTLIWRCAVTKKRHAHCALLILLFAKHCVATLSLKEPYKIFAGLSIDPICQPPFIKAWAPALRSKTASSETIKAGGSNEFFVQHFNARRRGATADARVFGKNAASTPQ